MPNAVESEEDTASPTAPHDTCTYEVHACDAELRYRALEAAVAAAFDGECSTSSLPPESTKAMLEQWLGEDGTKVAQLSDLLLERSAS